MAGGPVPPPLKKPSLREVFRDIVTNTPFQVSMIVSSAILAVVIVVVGTFHLCQHPPGLIVIRQADLEKYTSQGYTYHRYERNTTPSNERLIWLAPPEQFSAVE